MRIPEKGTDKAILNLFRVSGPCELCHHWCERREAAHILHSGCGGGGRIDLRINLLGLGGPFACNCHGRYHADLHIEDLCEIVARRERFPSGSCVLELLWFIRRLPKGSEVPWWAR